MESPCVRFGSLTWQIAIRVGHKYRLSRCDLHVFRICQIFVLKMIYGSQKFNLVLFEDSSSAWLFQKVAPFNRFVKNLNLPQHFDNVNICFVASENFALRSPRCNTRRMKSLRFHIWFVNQMYHFVTRQ